MSTLKILAKCFVGLFFTYSVYKLVS